MRGTVTSKPNINKRYQRPDVSPGPDTNSSGRLDLRLVFSGEKAERIRRAAEAEELPIRHWVRRVILLELRKES